VYRLLLDETRKFSNEHVEYENQVTINEVTQKTSTPPSCMHRLITSLLLTAFLWLVCSKFAHGQTPTYLPLQPHKLWYARKILLEALPKNDSATVAEACYLFGKTYSTAGDYRTAQF